MRPYSKIEDVIDTVLVSEGVKNGKTGYYTKDGTVTNYGIAFEHNQDILALCGITSPDQMVNLTLGVAIQIYTAEYWDKSKAFLFRKELAYQIFDAAVNQGVGASIRMTQQMHNIFYPDNEIDVDGGFGPITAEAIDYLRRTINHNTLLAVYREIRKVRYYKTLFRRARAIPDDMEALLDDFESSWISRV